MYQEYLFTLKTLNMKRLLFVVTTLFLFSCNNNVKENNKISSQADHVTSIDSSVTSSNQEEDTATAISKSPSIPIPQHIDWDKKLIKTATIDVEVNDLNKYLASVLNTARSLGGYIASEEQNEAAGKKQATLSIKIPVAQFEPMLNQSTAGAEKILQRKVTSDDVTNEYVDTKSRLRTKEEMRQKYLEFMQRAKTMKDVIQVEKEIGELQEGMDAASGRINYLSHQSAFSTINISVAQVIVGYKPPVSTTPSFYARLTGAFKSGVEFMSALTVGLVTIWPLILLVVVVWIPLRKYMLRPETQKKSS
jgi:hypothetical protein